MIHVLYFALSFNAVAQPDLLIGRYLSTTATQSTPRWISCQCNPREIIIIITRKERGSPISSLRGRLKYVRAVQILLVLNTDILANAICELFAVTTSYCLFDDSISKWIHINRRLGLGVQQAFPCLSPYRLPVAGSALMQK